MSSVPGEDGIEFNELAEDEAECLKIFDLTI